jgi:pentatricopeptide repeat protein
LPLLWLYRPCRSNNSVSDSWMVLTCRAWFSTQNHHHQNRYRHEQNSLQRQRELEGLTRPKKDHGIPRSNSINRNNSNNNNNSPNNNNRNNAMMMLAAEKKKWQDMSRQNNQEFRQYQQLQKAATHRLVELQSIPRGALGVEEWRKAQQLMDFWCSGQASVKDHAHYVTNALCLLERLLQERNKILVEGNSDNRNKNNQCVVRLSETILMESQWLERVTRTWQTWIKRQSQHQRQRQQLHQQQQQHDLEERGGYNHQEHHHELFLDKLESLSDSAHGLLPMNARIYAMIMNVVPRQQSNNNTNNTNKQQQQQQEERIAQVEYMESLLERMRQRNIIPDRDHYTILLQAWEFLGEGSRAMSCLERLCDEALQHHQQQQDQKKSSSLPSLLQPTRDCFQSVLNALVRGPNKSPDTITQCRTIITKMKEYHKTMGWDTEPGIRAYNTLLLSLLHHSPHVGNNENNDDGSRIMEQAEHIFRHEIPSQLRDKQTYHGMLELYSQRGLAQQATELLQHMYDDYRTTKNPRIAPYTKSFNLVLAALYKAKDYGGVEQQFQFMEQLSDDNANNKTGGGEGLMRMDVAPDRYTYTILLSSWAQQVGLVPDACERCDYILHTMKRLAASAKATTTGNQKKKESIRPTTVTYSIVMKAHSKVGNVRRVEELLGEMMDEYLQTKNPDIRPDVTAFNILLLALARSQDDDAVPRIQSMIQRMEDITNKGIWGENVCLEPTVATYNCLLQALARSKRRGAGEECERLIVDKMIPNQHLTPDMQSWTSLVHAYANAGKAEHAERILERVCEKYYQQDTAMSRPTVQLITTVMTAWAKSETSEAPEMARRLLDRMTRLSEADDLSGSIDVVCYNTLLDAWSKSGRSDSGPRCLEILQAMEDNGITPDTISFNTTLNALAEYGNVESCEVVFERMQHVPGARPGHDTLSTLLKAWSNTPSIKADDYRAEVVLRKIHELQKSTGIVANVACYNIVLGCLAKSESMKSCQIGEDLLLEMERLSREESGGVSNRASVRPDLVSYTTVIHAYAKLGEAHKAEMVLERLVKEYVRRGTKGACLKPSTKTFNTTLRAWAEHARRTSSSPEAPTRCEALLERMKRLHATSNAPVKPDVQSYNHLLDCWGHSGIHGSVTRALAILEEMIASNDNDISPDTVSYNTVIAAMSRTGDFERAESLLNSMYDKYQHLHSLGVPSLAKPNLISWNSLMAAYSKSKRPEALVRAEAAIEKMKALHVSGELQAKPDVTSFNCLLQCLARSALPSNDAAERCEAIFRDLMSQSAAGDPTMTPDSHSYAATITAWKHGGNADRAVSLMLEMCNDTGVKPDVEMFRFLLKTLAESSAAARLTVEENVRRRMVDLYPHLLDINTGCNDRNKDIPA